MILAPLAAAALLVSVATAPNANPALSPTLSMQQKSAAMQPLMRSATECIARTVSTDPRFGQPDADLGEAAAPRQLDRLTQQRDAAADLRQRKARHHHGDQNAAQDPRPGLPGQRRAQSAQQHATSGWADRCAACPSVA